MMSNLRICPQNFFDEAVVTASPAMVTTLPVTNAQLTARDKVARSTSIADQVITGNWAGNGRRLNSLFLFRHTAHGGLVKLRLFLNAAEVYTSGTLEVYPLVDIFSEWGDAPLGMSNSDLLALEAPYFLYFPLTACDSFELTFTRCQSQIWEFGRIFLGKYEEAPYNPKYGMQMSWKSNTLQTRTKGASTRVRAGSRWREFKADMFYLEDDQRAVWRDLTGRIDKTSDVAIAVYPELGGRQERDYVANMQLLDHSPFVTANVDFNSTTFNFTEI